MVVFPCYDVLFDPTKRLFMAKGIFAKIDVLPFGEITIITEFACV